MLPTAKTLQPGDRVKRTMGLSSKGTVTDPFPWWNQTDGGYTEPGANDIPVQWDNGTRGSNRCHET
jgi:hypothetical protein